MKQTDNEIFVMINYKTNVRHICTWNKGVEYFFGQKIVFIGDVGGYNNLLQDGFVDRRFNKPRNSLSKSMIYFFNKMERKHPEMILWWKLVFRHQFIL